MSRARWVPVVGVLALAVVLARGQEAPPPPPDLAAMLAEAGASVVQVEVEGDRPRGDAPRWRWFRQVAGRRAGAGVVVDERWVVTHASLAAYDPPRFTITTSEGVQVVARLVRLDQPREVALLEAEERLGAVPARLGSSRGVHVGQVVAAVGDPFGTARDAQAAATWGVIEGVVALDARESSFAGPVLLTDAALNPGSEGGALLDLHGRVVGLLAPLVRDARTGDLTGYALPVEACRAVIEAAARPRSPLGIQGRVEAGVGVLVVTVEPGGAAAAAGLRAGDLIVAADGAPVRSGEDLRAAVAASGEELAVEYVRGSARRTVRLRWEVR